MAQLPWKANTEDNKQTLGDFSPVPSGKYPAMINKSEMKLTKNKDGHYLQLGMVVFEGDYQGKLLTDRLNLDNPNPVAVEIANKALNTICQACGKVGVEDSEELHGIPMILTVKFKAETDTNPASNDITYYEPYTPDYAQETAETGVVAGPESVKPAAHPAVQKAAQTAVNPAVKPAANPAFAAAKPAAKPAAKKLPWEK